jgi:ribosomal protein S15P/S13E
MKERRVTSAVIGSIVAALTALAGAIAGHRKAVADATRQQADAGHVANDTAVQMMEQMRIEVGRLSARVSDLEEDNARLRSRVSQLESHLHDHGLDLPEETRK